MINLFPSNTGPLLGMGVNYQNAIQKQDAERQAYEQAILGSVTPPPTMETFAPQQMSFRPGALGIMALANILGNVIEPGAGNQGLNAFLGTVQGRIDQQNQAQQMAVQQRNQLAQMQADFARRQKEAQADAAKVRLGFAQQDVQRAEGRIDQFRQQAIADAKEKDRYKKLQQQQFASLRGQYNTVSTTTNNPQAILSMLDQLQSEAADNPELLGEFAMLKAQSGPLIDRARSKARLDYIAAAQRMEKTFGGISEDDEKMLRETFKSYGLTDEELDYIPGVSLSTTKARLDIKQKELRNQITEVDAKYAQRMKDLKIKGLELGNQEKTKRLKKLDQEISVMANAAQGKGPDGKPLTVTAAFNALVGYENKITEAQQELGKESATISYLETKLNETKAGNLPKFKDGDGNLITDKKQMIGFIEAEIESAKYRKSVAETLANQLGNAEGAVKRIREQANQARNISGSTQVAAGDPLGGPKADTTNPADPNDKRIVPKYNMTRYQIYQQALEAIQAGKDKNYINQQLKAAGVQPLP